MESDGTGNVSFSLQPGQYDVSAQSDAGAQGSLRDVAVTSHADTDQTLHLGSVAAAGPAATAVGSVPTATATVPLPVSSSAVPQASPTVTATAPITGANGSGSLVVSVVLAPGKPIGADIAVLAGTRNAAYQTAGSNGVSNFTLKPGVYSVSAAVPPSVVHGSSSGITVSAGSVTRVTVDLRAGYLHVEVLTRAGQPERSAFAFVGDSAGQVDYNSLDPQGTVTFLLFAGTYSVAIRGYGSATAIASAAGIQVVAGQTTTRTLKET
jgi:hypothetical protein